MSEQTQTAYATATSNTESTESTNNTTAVVKRQRRVGIFTRIANFFHTALDVVEEVVVDTVPATGKTIYHSVSMVNKTAGKAHLSMAIENFKDLKELKDECELTEAEFEMLKKECKL